MAPFSSHIDQLNCLPVVKAVTDQAGVNVPRDRWDVRTTGSAHIVINIGHELSVRVAKTSVTASKVARRTEILRMLPYDLPFEVPRPVTRVITRSGQTAVGITWIKGEPRRQGMVPPKQLAVATRAIHSIDYLNYAPYLDSPHQHWGGMDWPTYLREQLFPLLLKTNRKLAEATIDSVLSLDPVKHCFIHGDLAGHNILWNGDKLVGVIDWDHATIADPGFDFASLGNYYGWDSLKKAATAEEIERAKVIARLLPLQALAYTVSHGMGGAILRLAVERADNWLMDHRSELVSY